MVLIAHLHVCQVLTGQEQLNEAETLHGRNADVPVPVKEQIALLNEKARLAKLEITAAPKAVKKRRIGRKTSL